MGCDDASTSISKPNLKLEESPAHVILQYPSSYTTQFFDLAFYSRCERSISHFKTNPTVFEFKVAM